MDILRQKQEKFGLTYQIQMMEMQLCVIMNSVHVTQVCEVWLVGMCLGAVPFSSVAAPVDALNLKQSCVR